MILQLARIARRVRARRALGLAGVALLLAFALFGNALSFYGSSVRSTRA